MGDSPGPVDVVGDVQQARQEGPVGVDRLGLLGVAVAGAAALLGAGAAWWRLRPTDPSDRAVSLLFAQSLPDAQGRPLALSGFAGRPLVLNFWATWCPPCVEEMPELSELHADLSRRGLQTLGIAIDTAVKVADFAAKRPVSYPLAVAGMSGTELVRQFGNPTGALPFTVLIDRDGRIVHRILGRFDIVKLRGIAEQLLA
jgi:peroxiredoxin